MLRSSSMISTSMSGSPSHNGRSGSFSAAPPVFTAAYLIDKLGLIPHPEGGSFLETFRSGAVPMTSRGQTAYVKDMSVTEKDKVAHVKNTDLVHGHARECRRPDNDARRNCLTSIYWMPTTQSPMLGLAVNYSDHVHYYQGGLPFKYYLVEFQFGADADAADLAEEAAALSLEDSKDRSAVDVELNSAADDAGNFAPPKAKPVPLLERSQTVSRLKNRKDYTATLKTYVLGPNLDRGEILQLPVNGGTWKAGHLCSGDLSSDCCLIGEAVAPGFDFHDFTWVSRELLEAVTWSSSGPTATDSKGIEGLSIENAATLRRFLHERIDEVKNAGAKMKDVDRHYDP